MGQKGSDLSSYGKNMTRDENTSIRYVLGISGASGAAYGICLLNFLLREQYTVYLTLTQEARLIMNEETDLDWGTSFDKTQSILKRRYAEAGPRLIYCDEGDMTAPISSGSHRVNGMIIAPCSMKTVAAIAHGMSSNLVERAADVALKERRPLILVPRETPLHTIHLKNLLTLSEMGATLIPAMPAFYNHPRTLDDMINFIAGRVLDALKIDHQIYTRWE